MAPKYPVVDSAPGVNKIMGNLNLSDILTWGGITFGSMTFGYWAGKVPYRTPSMYVFGFTGFLAGYFKSLQDSNGRLMGYLPNDAEVRSYAK